MEQKCFFSGVWWWETLFLTWSISHVYILWLVQPPLSWSSFTSWTMDSSQPFRKLFTKRQPLVNVASLVDILSSHHNPNSEHLHGWRLSHTLLYFFAHQIIDEACPARISAGVDIRIFFTQNEDWANEGLPYGCFLKWWYPQNTPKWSFLVGKPVVGEPTILGNPHINHGLYIRTPTLRIEISGLRNVETYNRW